MQSWTSAFLITLLATAVSVQSQALVPFTYTYGNIYCSSGIPQGPFALQGSCVSLSATASIGGSSGSSCSPDGNWVMYNYYNASGSCSGGPVTRMKAGATSCQGGGGVEWYAPYCDTGDSNARRKTMPLN